jgi:hypothetical protein
LPARGAAAASATDPAAPITGSGIPATRAEKMVGQTGGQDCTDNKSALPSPLRGN